MPTKPALKASWLTWTCGKKKSEKKSEKKGSAGFLSQTTAEGLRVTLSSTLLLLEYVTTKLNYKYLMTSRLCQDPMERVVGIVRQMSGSNDHPSPSQFLISINTLSFQNLAKFRSAKEPDRHRGCNGHHVS